MAKIDKSLYTKAEWKEIKRLRKEEKLAQSLSLELPEISDKEKNYVLCLKHGVKYSSDYVNILNSMVKRNCTIPYEFVCLTDNSYGLDPSIKTLPLPSNLQGWWCKPYMFSNEMPLNGNILYMDLDVVIANNIDKLFTYDPQKWCVIRDFTRIMRPNWNRYNSSVVRFRKGQLSHVWENFIKDKESIQKRLFGDQDWLYEATRQTPASFWPDEWIKSWKWEVRKSKDLEMGLKGQRKLKVIENVTPKPECCITVFHGDPNPHNCDDPWVVENWK